MNDTPDDIDAELAKLRQDDGDAIDVNHYKKRFRLLKAVGLGAFAAGLVALLLYMKDSRRNPCERVRDYYCKQEGLSGTNCKTYQEILEESVQDGVAEMRQNIRAQCVTKIERLHDEDGISVK